MNGFRRTGRRRRLLVGCCAAALLAGAAGTANAVDNLPPKQPLVKDLQTGSKACATGDDTVYVASAPTLTAVLYDPEEDNRPGEVNGVKGEFEAWWTDSAGVEQRRTLTTNEASSGAQRSWPMPADIPADTTISWHVRANDGQATSAWSDEGDGSVCSFVHDDVSPERPVVTSSDYPEEQIQDGVGVYGSFTLDSPSPDVVAYRYNFIGQPYATARPDEMGGPATIRFLPVRSGTDYLTVQSIDRSDRVSTTTTYWIRVRSGRAPVAHWKLDDPADSRSAAAETGSAARVGTGATFGGPAPTGTGATATVALDGTGHGFLTPDAPAADLRKSFAVSAWVRPAETGRTMTVASQDAAGTPGFALGLRAGNSGPAWSFAIGGTRITGGAPETGEWAHVLGLYDAETGKARLYVNGREVGTAVEATPTEASGAFQIGRARGADGYRDRWHGDVGDVQVHDRVVVPGEVTELAQRTPKRLGHWSLDDATDGVSSEGTGGAPLRIGGGATVYRGSDGSCLPELDPDCPPAPEPLVGEGHLSLDGETGYAATDGPVVDTGDSFTLGVIARLADSEPAHPMTVLSQAGEHTDAFKVRYQPSDHAWQLVMPVRDEAGAPERVVSRSESADGGEGQGHRLAVVYDDASDTIKLYVDGSAGAEAATEFPNGWHSAGALQVGRGEAGDGWGEYLHGDVDEVQAYAGVLSGPQIAQLGWGAGIDP